MSMVQLSVVFTLTAVLAVAESSAIKCHDYNHTEAYICGQQHTSGDAGVFGRYVAIFNTTTSCQLFYDDMKSDYEAGTLAGLFPRNMTFNTNHMSTFEVVIYDAFPMELGTVAGLECVTDLLQDHASFHAVSSGSQSAHSWALDRIDQRAPSLDGTYSWASDGTGAVVFVIDTGVNADHPGWNPGQVQFGADCVLATCKEDSDPGDPEGHGTHVAGTVASASYGVAKGATIISVRVLDDTGTGSWAGVIAGIVWATNYVEKSDRDQKYVINLSVGGVYDAQVNQAVDDASAAGIVVVVAAGNEGADACNYSPAAALTAVTVSSTDTADNRPWFANYGACVTISAPGVDIPSLDTFDGVNALALSGSSMSTGLVSGVVAQIRGLHPSLTVDETVIELVCDATKDAIQDEPLLVVDAVLYNKDFEFVNKTCPTIPPVPVHPLAKCTGSISWVGDGWCDSFNNNVNCSWDGGDCCTGTCNPEAAWPCGINQFDCLDPDGNDIATTTKPTSTLDPYPGCDVPSRHFMGDGWCDGGHYNVEECAWDGGDCCQDTCNPDAAFECSANAPYDCLDPDSTFGPAPSTPIGPSRDCLEQDTVTGNSLGQYWTHLASDAGLDLSRVGFNTNCQSWFYDGVSTCIGWGEFNDHSCNEGAQVCVSDDACAYGRSVDQVRHVQEMVQMGAEHHYLCPVCYNEPDEGVVHACHDGQLHVFHEDDDIPQFYDYPAAPAVNSPATWIDCDCERHHVGHQLIDGAYWWLQAQEAGLDPSLVSYYDDSFGSAWYYDGAWTCVGMGAYGDTCSTLLYCAGAPFIEPVVDVPPGKKLVHSYGAAKDQLRGVVDAIANGGTHASCENN